VILSATALENLGFLGLSLLAVAGGAVAGAALTAAAVWLACRFLARQQPPQVVRKLLRWLGGIAGALAVAGFLKFGGGSGWLLGSGPGLGGEQPGAGTPRIDAAPAKSPETAPKASAEPPPARADRVRVVVLGGELVHSRAFYRIEGEKQATDLKGVQEHVKRRRQAGPLAGVDILIYQNSLDYNTDAVKQLRAWLTEDGLTTNLIELRGDIPP
jgi:hypothetical protein